MSDQFEVPASVAGMRIDRALSLLTGRSRSDVSARIEAGAVMLDGKVVTAGREQVNEGDEIELVAELFEEEIADVLPLARAMDLAVVFEDDTIIVIDKPAGLVVHPGAGHRDDTLVSGLIEQFADLEGAFPKPSDRLRPGIVHRLDKDTSGLLVVARTEAARDSLVGQLQSHEMGRQYRAIVCGEVVSESGVIDAPIGRSIRTRTAMAVSLSGKPARTHYELVRRFDAPLPATELQVNLETGRTHQIRVHFASIGHPVLGDTRYGGRRSDVALGRPFLHAEKLTLRHPKSGAEMEFTAPLPVELVAVLEEFSATSD